MSLKEIQNLSSMMRTLGYPRPISMECFKNPNFPLVAEMLYWLAQHFDSNLDISRCIDSEQDRVIFMKSIVQLLSTKTSVILNPKRLYEADGHAVKEMLKLVSVVYSALKLDKDMDSINNEDLSLSEAVKQLQLARSLASQLTSMGVSLKSFMAQEADFRQARNEAIDRHLDVQWVEKCLSDATDFIWGEVSKLENALSRIKEDERALDEKIENRLHELERNQTRLSTLQSVRPAYMDEYEQLEKELKIQYETYLCHFRNISYLESLKGETSSSDYVNENVMDSINKSAVEEVQKTSFGVDGTLFNTEMNIGGNVFARKNRSTSFRNFDNSNSEETNSSSDQTDSEDPITNDSENNNRQDFGLYENYDFVKGLSVVGHGYRMVGDWTPCKSGDKAEVNSSSAFSGDGEISRHNINKVFLEALAEADKLMEEIENEQKANGKLKNVDSYGLDEFSQRE